MDEIKKIVKTHRLPVDVVYAAIEPCRCIFDNQGHDACIVHGELPMSYDHHLAIAAIDALAAECDYQGEKMGRITELKWMEIAEWLRGENT